jgi:alternate F1F0 ATPase F1 subunit epsilon
MNLKVCCPFKSSPKNRRDAHCRGDALTARSDSCRTGSIAWRRSPGILIYETEADGEVFVAVDEGVLVKTGPDVLVSVRRAIGRNGPRPIARGGGKEFLTLDEHEQSTRTVMAKLETGFLRRFATFQNE